MKAWKIALAVAFSLFAIDAMALGEWCGARRHGSLNKLIPDYFRPDRITLTFPLCGYVPGGPSARFVEACRLHDRCYWTFGMSKDACDRSFREQLDQSCRETYHQKKHRSHLNCCLKATPLYERAVHKMGGDSYREAQIEARDAAELYRSRTGRVPKPETMVYIADLCLTHQNANGVCEIHAVVGRVLNEELLARTLK